LLVLKNVVFDGRYGLCGHISTDEFSTIYFIIDYVMQSQYGQHGLWSLSAIGVLAFIFNMDCAGEIAGKRR
jgi:hypothetical protein